MSSNHLVSLIDFLDPVFCFFVLLAMWRARVHKTFLYLSLLVAIRLLGDVGCSIVAAVNMDDVSAYRAYFSIYWLSYLLSAALSLMVVYSVFRLAMEPLKGLQTLGILVFRWAGAISMAVALGMALAPHQAGLQLLVGVITQFQRTSSVLTLCLLMFVCFAIRPMGLSFRSRIFGISFGLGLTASVSLVSAAWLVHSKNMHSSLPSLLSGVAGVISLVVWSAYFTFPEPKRRIIVLPTTSPFLRWNQISEVLGDEPGYVAIAGIPPEIFAPAEIEMMRRASVMMEAAPPPEAMSAAALKSLSA